MAFVFDSTVGGASANSLCSVDDALTYFGGRLNAESFENATTAKQQKALVMSTTRINAERFSGRMTSQSQALQFPREVIFDKDGFALPTDTIPPGVVNAVCEMALFYLDHDDEGYLTDHELHDAQYLNSWAGGPLSLSFKKNAKADELPNAVKRELRGIGVGVWLGTGNTGIMIR